MLARALSLLKGQQSAFKAAGNAACYEVNGLARCAKLKFALSHDGVLKKKFFGRLNLKLITRKRGNYFHNFAPYFELNPILFLVIFANLDDNVKWDKIISAT